MIPLISLVVPTYNVEPYVGAFLESLAGQAYPLDRVELLFIDDGSTDSSAEIISTWIAEVAPSATLLQKENGGLSSARNAGLDHVSGAWVTFSDPDDTLAPNYLAEVAGFLAEPAAADVHLVACRLLMLDDETGQLSDTHPLRFRFANGNRVVDLDRHPTFIHLSAASGFYRTEVVEAHHLRFDARVRPNGEDCHFTGRYLAKQQSPRVAFLRDAVYRYRRRADSSSLVQNSWSQPEKLTEVPRHGHLDLLRQVHAERGETPVWLQNLVLYDLLYYFKYDELATSPLTVVCDATSRRFHEVLPEITRFIDTATIDDYRVSVASADIRNALVIGAKGERLRPERLRLERVDADQRLALVRYFYGGDLPYEEFRYRGQLVEPVHGKCRSLTYLGRRMASERIAWLAKDGPIEITLDGRRMPLAVGRGARTQFVVDPARHLRRLAAVPQANPYDDAPRRVNPTSDSELYLALRRRAADVRRWYRRTIIRIAGGRRSHRYRDAWVFMDRRRLAQDNAEHLYRFVKDNHPDINSWFVIDRDSGDWARLAHEGFRLVAYGSRDHQLLALTCAELISSQADDDVFRPSDTRRFGRPRWRFTFLQHGVTKDDVSRWVNRRPISRFITATEAEYQSIAGDDTPYVVCDKEVVLTGLPRHDRLSQLAADPRILAADRLLLIMPTWRRALAEVELGGSPYAKQWRALLGSDRLRQLAERAGLRIAFIPHPNASALLSGAALPAHVEASRYEDIDIQQLFARGAAIITDYSSNAFELAYLDRPVVYFQFDRDRFFSGEHIYRRAAWSYEDDGFGPVVESVSQVLDELERLIAIGMTPQEPYATRMANAFAYRDGKSCERVFESILSARQPAVRSRR